MRDVYGWNRSGSVRVKSVNGFATYILNGSSVLRKGSLNIQRMANWVGVNAHFRGRNVGDRGDIGRYYRGAIPRIGSGVIIKCQKRLKGVQLFVIPPHKKEKWQRFGICRF